MFSAVVTRWYLLCESKNVSTRMFYGASRGCVLNVKYTKTRQNQIVYIQLPSKTLRNDVLPDMCAEIRGEKKRKEKTVGTRDDDMDSGSREPLLSLLLLVQSLGMVDHMAAVCRVTFSRAR